jgi:hypothetical protein
MSKDKKKIRIRRAKIGDRNLFIKLWTEYLEDNKLREGGVVPPTEHNMEVFTRIFDSYVNGEYEGVVLLHAEDAVLMWGDPGGQLFETEQGRQATAWGAYVKPGDKEDEIMQAIQMKACNILKNMGFDIIHSSLVRADKRNMKFQKDFGFEIQGYLVSKDLRSN